MCCCHSPFPAVADCAEAAGALELGYLRQFKSILSHARLACAWNASSLSACPPIAMRHHPRLAHTPHQHVCPHVPHAAAATPPTAPCGATCTPGSRSTGAAPPLPAPAGTLGLRRRCATPPPRARWWLPSQTRCAHGGGRPGRHPPTMGATRCLRRPGCAWCGTPHGCPPALKSRHARQPSWTHGLQRAPCPLHPCHALAALQLCGARQQTPPVQKLLWGRSLRRRICTESCALLPACAPLCTMSHSKLCRMCIFCLWLYFTLCDSMATKGGWPGRLDAPSAAPSAARCGMHAMRSCAAGHLPVNASNCLIDK